MGDARLAVLDEGAIESVCSRCEPGIRAFVSGNEFDVVHRTLNAPRQTAFGVASIFRDFDYDIQRNPGMAKFLSGRSEELFRGLDAVTAVRLLHGASAVETYVGRESFAREHEGDAVHPYPVARAELCSLASAIDSGTFDSRFKSFRQIGERVRPVCVDDVVAVLEAQVRAVYGDEADDILKTVGPCLPELVRTVAGQAYDCLRLLGGPAVDFVDFSVKGMAARMHRQYDDAMKAFEALAK